MGVRVDSLWISFCFFRRGKNQSWEDDPREEREKQDCMLGRKKRKRRRKIHTSERPLCHDSSTSAKDVGAAEVQITRSDKVVMKMNDRDSCIIFIF